MSTCLDPFPLFVLFVFFLVSWEFLHLEVRKTARATEKRTRQGYGKEEAKAGRTREALGGCGSRGGDDEACDATGSLFGHFPCSNQSHFIRSPGREGKQNRLDRRCWAMLYFFDRHIHLVITITDPTIPLCIILHHHHHHHRHIRSTALFFLDLSFFDRGPTRRGGGEMHREVGAGQRKPAFAYWSVLGEWV